MLKGILCCMSANFLFGLGYYFAILLRPLSGESMFGYRIFVLAPFILLAIIFVKQAGKFSDFFAIAAQFSATIDYVLNDRLKDQHKVD